MLSSSNARLLTQSGERKPQYSNNKFPNIMSRKRNLSQSDSKKEAGGGHIVMTNFVKVVNVAKNVMPPTGRVTNRQLLTTATSLNFSKGNSLASSKERSSYDKKWTEELGKKKIINNTNNLKVVYKNKNTEGSDVNDSKDMTSVNKKIESPEELHFIQVKFFQQNKKFAQIFDY
jgi:hypothetical protein